MLLSLISTKDSTLFSELLTGLEWTQDPPVVDYLASPGEFNGGGPGLEL